MQSTQEPHRIVVSTRPGLGSLHGSRWLRATQREAIGGTVWGTEKIVRCDSSKEAILEALRELGHEPTEEQLAELTRCCSSADMHGPANGWEVELFSKGEEWRALVIDVEGHPQGDWCCTDPYEAAIRSLGLAINATGRWS